MKSKTEQDIDDSAMKDFKLICNKGIEYKILDGMKYFDVECWAKIANVSGTGKVRVYIQWKSSSFIMTIEMMVGKIGANSFWMSLDSK